MEERDRRQIQSNLSRLLDAPIRNLTEFYSELISRNVFSVDMIEEIQGNQRREKEQIFKLYLQVLTRGPNAFRNLVEALDATGNIFQARLLDPNFNGFDAAPPAPLALEDDNLNAAEAEPIQRHNPAPAPAPALAPAPGPSASEDIEHTYQIKSTPKGFALILNVIDFDGNPSLRRDGAQHDSEKLKIFLTDIGYEVDVVLNPKKQELLCQKSGILKKFTDKFSLTNVDSCIVSIMSHGEDNFWIQTSDCESIKDETSHLVHLWDEIYPRFNNQYLPSMRNKPKVFIIQSCRGDRIHKRIRISPLRTNHSRIRYDYALRNLTDEEEPQNESWYENHPEYNHMMVLQSTIPGYVSVRHEEKGSPFIQILCKLLDTNTKRSSKSTLADLVPEIAKQLQELPPDDGGPQTCTFKIVGYCKKIYIL